MLNMSVPLARVEISNYFCIQTFQGRGTHRFNALATPFSGYRFMLNSVNLNQPKLMLNISISISERFCMLSVLYSDITPGLSGTYNGTPKRPVVYLCTLQAV